MVPLAPAATRFVRSWLEPPEAPGLLALHHALAYRRAGLRGNDPASPRSVILVREGDGRLEAFGAGEPGPAVDWLAGHPRGFTLLAPGDWARALTDRVVGVARERVETWSGAEGSGAGAGAAARRLTHEDFPGFAATVPAWGLRGWRSYPALIEHGAAFGVPHGTAFAALAWVFDQAGPFDALGVYTVPRFRRLGLGRAAASALVDHVVRRRGNRPLWSAAPGNAASRGLARA
ncbi:MAG: GNAT family N-acetyltransferase, partial [Planctomycetia bacterium]|nr:GNAT family N-acetyltransferase [Planctomycetia bacterium]